MGSVMTKIGNKKAAACIGVNTWAASNTPARPAPPPTPPLDMPIIKDEMDRTNRRLNEFSCNYEPNLLKQ